MAVAIATALGVSACGGDDSSGSGSGLPQGSETVDIDPSDFTTEIDNPYWPLKPGARWVSRETDQEGARQRVVVTVTNRTKKIANGVEARVVRDVVTDAAFGDFVEYEDGEIVSRFGSLEAGVDGAQPGVIVPADPEPGQGHRQEYYEGEAEDEGAILSLDAQAEVTAGHYKDPLLTQDANPLEPKVYEPKFYAKGVGPVLAISASGGTNREELLSYSKGG